MKGSLFIVGMCILFVGCEEVKRCETNMDCNKSEYCFDNGGYPHLNYCKEFPNYYNQEYFIGANMSEIYCYPNNEDGTECNCNVIIYPDGHNETMFCRCYSDLVMRFTCVNKTKENITVIENVKIMRET